LITKKINFKLEFIDHFKRVLSYCDCVFKLKYVFLTIICTGNDLSSLHISSKMFSQKRNLIELKGSKTALHCKIHPSKFRCFDKFISV